MKMPRWLIAFGLWTGFAAVTACDAAQKGVIDDPDGHSNLRSGQQADATVVARVPAGEVFEFEPGEGSEWWRVTLKSGKTGWMHYSRIVEHAEMSDLSDGEVGDELVLYGQRRGVNYHALARGAAKGESAAMKAYFAITDTDGAAKEAQCVYFRRVVHLLGDEKWSAFLGTQALDYRLAVRQEYVDGMGASVFEPMGYLQRHFPKTAALLFRKEIVGLVSPDGKFAVRKGFSTVEPREDSRVVRSEVIEVAAGKEAASEALALADLLPDDQGEGMDREGQVLWSPDSRRFAMCSVVGMSTKTVIYQAAGAKFLRVEVAEAELPGRAGDAELKGAKKIFTCVDPLRWEAPQMLVLRQHEYWEGKHADGSLNAIGRTYVISVVVAGGRGKVEKVVVER
ncbi:MAG TPA: SH3 domain-containing protein [Verrucomicrobium sp.]|nr:SH3 domain-containing protein [Verrucomicrobium sp.]